MEAVVIGENDIAIIGMAAHLPGADGIDAYWQLLSSGSSAIRRLSDEELLKAGEDPARMARPDYVPYSAPLEGFERFEPEFFGFSPKEAAILDPQHRQLLEVGWEALENAGHMPETFKGPIGVYAGCGMGSYFYFNLCSNPDLVDEVGMFLLRHTGNDKDFLATRLSHVFDLTGPSVNVQTACSTSLVATHYAAQALLNGECDMAIAGGVTLEIPQKRGYVYKPGEVLSPDGQCHAFDHRAQGTVFGSGAGAVVLRRAKDAVADGDHIWAIIKGSAVNNDGADKAGYLAPSVTGQAHAVADALALAEVRADSIDYIECHGTGTYLGDPIEIAALSEAFRETTEEVGFCRVGSVKTNIGHLDTGAGVASLIKTALSLHHRQIPPSLGYESPNPAIDFEHSPFRVNDTLSDWTSHKGPRRAGVNSLGVGGTNAHVVLEEAPTRAASEESDWPFQLLTLSARNSGALEEGAERLAEHLRSHRGDDLADIAWTLKEGRRAFERRRVLVAESHEEAAALLKANDPRRVFTHSVLAAKPEIAFLFPGGGAQYVNMARDLYETEPVFAEWIDKALDILAPKLDRDLRALWLPEPGEEAAASKALMQPSLQLPLIVTVEYALAQLLMSWGVKPAAMAGHSLGEYTAACLAGVMSLEDCLGLVHLRATLMDTVRGGDVLSVPLSEAELAPLLEDRLDIAVINAPDITLASGTAADLDWLEAKLAGLGVEARRIPVGVAAHSRMLDPILEKFRAHLATLDLRAPVIPITSNRTGTWMEAEQATNPDYWVEHLRHTVRFSDCIATLAQAEGRIFLEVGPGTTLSSLARSHPEVSPNQVVNTMRHPKDDIADDKVFIAALGRLWALGAGFDWQQIWGEARRWRVVLPSYAFQRASYYIEPGESAPAVPDLPMRLEDMADWGFAPVWKKRYADCAVDVAEDLAAAPPRTWLVFADDTGLADSATKRLRKAGHRVICVRTGDAFARTGEDEYILPPEQGRPAYDQLIQTLVAQGCPPDRIAHFWLVTDRERFRPGSSFFHRNLEQGFFSLMFLAQAISDEGLGTPLHLTVFTTGAAQVTQESLDYPEKATIAGPVRVIPHEFGHITASSLDLPVGARPVDAVLEEMLAEPANLTAALRGERRFEQGFAPAPLADLPSEVETGSVWMLTGGFGGIGRTIAGELVRRHKARLVLLSRSALPPRSQWSRATGETARRIAVLEELESLGAEVLVAQADVCNIEQMQAAREAAEARFGAVNGLIHAAGTVQDGPIAGKSVGDVEDVFAPKIHGLQVIDRIFPDGALDWLVLFGSTSTATAPMGQVDYVAANAYLDAFAAARAGGKTRTIALDWGIWADTGMAAQAIAEREGRRSDGPARPVDAPLLQGALLDASHDRVFTTAFSTRDWVIDEHRLASGEALLPGTGYLELAAEALGAQGETLPFEIRDLSFLRPLDVADGSARKARIRLRRSDEGYTLDIRSALPWQGGEGYVLNAEARLVLSGLQTPDSIDIPALTARCTRGVAQAGDQALVAAQEKHLAFGPRWQVLRRTALGDGEGIGELELPEAFRQSDGAMLLHPALMDIATGWAMELIPGYGGAHLWVPVSYGSVRVFDRLPARLTSWVRLASPGDNTAPFASFDIALADETGRVCVEISGFSIRRLDMQAGLALTAPPAAGEVESLTGSPSDARPLSAAEERLRHNLSQGIRAEEGGRAFLRALGQKRARVIVSSMPLAPLIAQAHSEAQAALSTGSGTKFERPALDSDFVAPEGPIETALAGFWEELLGVSEIGAQDSFFDLGGHSLIAVRLFAKVRKTWDVDFPISVLFEAPTIRKIAALIGPAETDESATAQGEGASGEGVQPARQQPRFKHLVAMHDGEGGAQRPFFLVAGMFGNVLNLRHLAHLLGADRPFYGLQARGLMGGEAPHMSMEEAAADHIAEIRLIQPHGPYLVGGFSGGGITAYEIARQLEAAGEEVAICIMLDSPLPQRRELSTLDRALIQLHELRRKGVLYPFTWAVNRVKWEIARRRGPTETARQHQFHDTAIEAAFLHAVAHYEAKPWRGNLVLYRPPLPLHWKVSKGNWVDSQRHYVFEDNDWSASAPNLRVFEVPGDHDSMVLEPNVRVLAGRMREAIEAAEAAIGAAQADEAGSEAPGANDENDDGDHPAPAPDRHAAE